MTRDHAFTVASGILSDALPAIAGEIERRGAELGLTRINERDHMKPWTMAVVRERARDAAGSPEAVSEASHGLGAVWGSSRQRRHRPHRGRCASGVRRVELKCGAGADALGPCAWDVLKLAFCISEGAAGRGFIMAAAPVASWDAGIRGAELFGRPAVTAEALRTDYADWWRHWEKDRAAARPEGYHPPASVPARFGTRPTGRAQDFTVGATPWRLRLAEVEIDGAERAPWPRLLRDDGSLAT